MPLVDVKRWRDAIIGTRRNEIGCQVKLKITGLDTGDIRGDFLGVKIRVRVA